MNSDDTNEENHVGKVLRFPKPPYASVEVGHNLPIKRHIQRVLGRSAEAIAADRVPAVGELLHELNLSLVELKFSLQFSEDDEKVIDETRWLVTLLLERIDALESPTSAHHDR